MWHGLVVSLVAVALCACATPVRHEAVPIALTDRATLLGGVPNARYFIDTQVPELAQEATAALARERAQVGKGAPLPPASFLAISGGGDNGAFGAGLLIGWTERGDRPEFKLVTGVSTGARIAPFAFSRPGLHHDPFQRPERRLPAADVGGPRRHRLPPRLHRPRFRRRASDRFRPTLHERLVEYGRQQMLAGTAWHEGSPIFGRPQAAH
jgi:hypothetical protein